MKTGRIVLAELGLPPSTNHLYVTDRNGRRRLSKEGEEYKGIVAGKAMAKKARFSKERPYGLTMWVYLAERSRDISNCIKIVEDGIFAGIQDNDKWVDLIGIRRITVLDKARERITVTLECIPEMVETPEGVKRRGQ